MQLPVYNPLKFQNQEYTFPIYTDIKPRDHQRKTVEFILDNYENKGCLINVDPGLGKTLSSLWALDVLIQSQKVKKCLIIAPLSTIGENVWLKEMKHLPHLKYNVLLGTKTRKQKLVNEESHIDFINIDGITAMLNSKTLPYHYDMIIYDECTALKNPKIFTSPDRTKMTRWGAFSKYVELLKPYLVIMTGTPVSNTPVEAWTLIKMINPEFNIKYNKWRDLTCYKKDLWNYKPRKNAAEIIANHLKPTLVIKADTCLDLPPIQVIPYKIEMSAQQAKVVEKLKRECMLEFENATISAFNPAVITNKMMQALGGVVYADDGSSVKLDFTERYKALLDIVANNTAPTVIFCGYKAMQAELLKKLNSDGISGMIINGEVKNEERQIIFKKFDEGELKVIICHEKTTAHGIDLTTSNTIVYYLPIYSNELYQQSLKRIRRISSEGKGHTSFRVFHFASTKWEEKRYAILEDREKLQDDVRNIMLELQNTNFESNI